MLAIRRFSVAAAVAILVACGGGGGGGSSSAPGPSKVFIAATIISSPPGIGSVINPDPPPGVLDEVDRLIQGGIAGTIGSLALDPQNDRLYVGNQVNVLVFNGAGFADGAVLAARQFSSLSGPAFNAASLFLDTVNDRLYVGDDATSEVRVFNGASGLHTAVDANRVITGFDTVLGVQVDTTTNTLYVTNHSPTNVYTIRVFAGANAVNGAAAVTHTITPNDGVTDMPVGDLFVDAAHDRLYVAGGTNSKVMVFENASGKNGTVTPDKTLIFPGGAGTNLKTVVVDTVHDRLYALGSGVVYSLNNVSTATGTTLGKAALAPAGVTFTAIAVSP